MKHVQSISKRAAARMTLALSAAIASPTFAALTPIPVTTSLTTEDFDSLGTTASTLMPGSWKWGWNSSSGSMGSYTSGHQTVDNVAGGGAVFATQGSYNFGAGNDATGSDRAIGCLTGSLYKDFTVYGYFQTPVVLPSFYVSYDIEKYRAGAYAGARVQMYFSLNGSSWTSAGSDFQTMYAADPASAVYAPAPGSTTTVSGVYTPSASIASVSASCAAANVANGPCAVSLAKIASTRGAGIRTMSRRWIRIASIGSPASNAARARTPAAPATNSRVGIGGS